MPTIKKKTKVKEEKKAEKLVKKTVVKKKTKEKVSPEKKTEAKDRYFQAVGRRKTSVARVRIWTKGSKEFLINGKPCSEYFPGIELQKIIFSPLERMNCLDKFKVEARVNGGGIHSQAEAVRHGISEVLVEFNPDFRKRLKKAKFLTRDPRMRERKKFGLKRARRAPQWRKR
jgi:small subunit ribosomal protein S9